MRAYRHDLPVIKPFHQQNDKALTKFCEDRKILVRKNDSLKSQRMIIKLYEHDIKIAEKIIRAKAQSTGIRKLSSRHQKKWFVAAKKRIIKAEKEQARVEGHFMAEKKRLADEKHDKRMEKYSKYGLDMDVDSENEDEHDGKPDAPSKKVDVGDEDDEDDEECVKSEHSPWKRVKQLECYPGTNVPIKKIGLLKRK